MYGPSPFSLGERELIGAYVSLLNACAYCHGSHLEVARVHGVDPALLEALAHDPAVAALDARWRSLFAYLRKLTRSPEELRPTDTKALLAAGWGEAEIVHATQVAAHFNYLNRIVNAFGIEADLDHYRAAGTRLAAEALAYQEACQNE